MNFTNAPARLPPLLLRGFNIRASAAAVRSRTMVRTGLLVQFSVVRQPEPDRKTVLGSRSSQTVQFWFDLPEPFPNPEPIVDFDFNYDDVKVLSSGFALLVN
ncbi:uncharacterized protein F5891DRAFT_1195343 [Suillus fuscotomentosus]|uniref:Uncharacterized protein n=1 Tax=Suillus fuscotomentosus TaxID=1912939 RepID=A0AAD4DXD5_9AGAM|nr:uncharacterized protein F5891DRAFT_1195343 [Suillus fuscotomentosus]KAG1894363.1 hypothetical protein F5891DRAFT_1195343 [Suillus fuscotomentosus]